MERELQGIAARSNRSRWLEKHVLKRKLQGIAAGSCISRNLEKLVLERELWVKQQDAIEEGVGAGERKQ